MTEADIFTRTLLESVQRIMIQKEAEIKAIDRYAALRFTPFKFVDSGEVQTTHLLSFFLNEQEDHGQGRVFLDSFIHRLNQINKKIAIPIHTYKVQAEKRHDGTRQIDLLLRRTNNSFGLCIENKLYAKDQVKQLSDYNQYLFQEFGHGNYLLLYLTPNKQPPSLNSISSEELSTLTASGQYLNITYQEFVLPLLDEWIKLAFPEKIKSFLLDFRYQLERKLNFTSTAPAAKMQQEEIAEYLISNPNLLKAAYELPNALELVQIHLKEKFATYVREVAGQFNLNIGVTTEDFNSFKNFDSETPCKLTRIEWGNCSIGLEFSGNTLDVGVVGGGKSSHAAQFLAQNLGKNHSSDSWAWWTTLYDNDLKSIYLDTANGNIKAKLIEAIMPIIDSLNILSQEGKI